VGVGGGGEEEEEEGALTNGSARPTAFARLGVSTGRTDSPAAAEDGGPFAYMVVVGITNVRCSSAALRGFECFLAGLASIRVGSAGPERLR
jgi:hypothetical protein